MNAEYSHTKSRCALSPVCNPVKFDESHVSYVIDEGWAAATGGPGTLLGPEGVAVRERLLTPGVWLTAQLAVKNQFQVQTHSSSSPACC